MSVYNTTYILKWRRSSNDYFSDQFTQPRVNVETTDEHRGYNELRIIRSNNDYRLYFDNKPVYRGDGEEPTISNLHVIVNSSGDPATLMDLDILWRALEGILCATHPSNTVTYHFYRDDVDNMRCNHQFFKGDCISDVVVGIMNNLTQASPCM